VRPLYEQALENIRAKVVDVYGPRKKRGHKRLYETLEIGKGDWSRKWRGETRFSDEDISALVTHFEAPNGWPYISWDAATASERAMQLLERFAMSTASPGPDVGPTAPASSGQPERRKRKGHL